MGKNKNKKNNSIAKPAVNTVAAPVQPVAPEVKPDASKEVPNKPTPEVKKPIQAGKPKTPKDTPKEPVIIQMPNLPSSTKDLNETTTHDLLQLSDVLLRRYKENPVEGLSKEIIDLYVGPNGFVDVIIAETAARVLASNNTLVIKNLPQNYRQTFLTSLSSLGISIKDPTQLELPFDGVETSMAIEASNVEIEEDIKKQATDDIKNESEAEAVEVKEGDSNTLKARLIKILAKSRQDEKPFAGLVEAIGTMTMQEILAESDTTKKKAIGDRTLSEKLNHLFDIIPFNTLFIVIGRFLVDTIKKSENPIEAFYYIKNNIEINENGKKVYPFTDEEIAEIIQIFVGKSIELFDETTQTRITAVDKGDKTSEANKRNIERWQKAIDAHREILCDLTTCTKERIAEITNKSSLIKQKDALKTDEEIAENEKNLVHTQAYFHLAKELGLTADTSEKDALDAIHNRAIGIVNLFRSVDDQLIPTGKLSIKTVIEPVKPVTTDTKTEPATPATPVASTEPVKPAETISAKKK